jgi:hypothetical protein
MKKDEDNRRILPQLIPFHIFRLMARKRSFIMSFFNRTSTELQPNFNRTSTELQPNFNLPIYLYLTETVGVFS